MKPFFKRHPKKTIFIFVLFVTVLLDFIAAQILSLVMTEYEKVEGKFRTYSNVFHHGLKPNVYVENVKWGYDTYKVHTNSLGFIDSKVRKIPLKPKKKRIVFIGDSFTEGLGVGYQDTFIGIIDKEWQKQNIEVLNAGVTSYSPIIYHAKIKYLLEEVKLKFARLIVFIDISDIINEAYHYKYVAQKIIKTEPKIKAKKTYKKGILRKCKDFWLQNTLLSGPILRNIWWKISKSSHEIQRMNNQIYYSLDNNASLWTVKKEAFEKYGKKGLAKAKKYMDKLLALLQKHHIELAIAVYPWPDQIYHRDLNSKQVQFWQKWAKKNNIGFMNFFPYFINQKDTFEILDSYFIPKDVHWNKAGHKLMARTFFKLYTKIK